eukprot:4099030-Pleurochrysis_carterae.AAC.2
MGHGQALTAVYADEGIYGLSPTTRSDVSDRQLYFTWCRLPRYGRPYLIRGSASYLDVEVGYHDLYMELRAIY